MAKKPESRPLPPNLPNSEDGVVNNIWKQGTPIILWNVIFWSGMLDFVVFGHGIFLLSVLLEKYPIEPGTNSVLCL